MQALLNVEVTGEPFELSAPSRYFLIGNGGSTTVAQHIAVDMVKNGFSAFALTDPAVMSMLANDTKWGSVFDEQILVHGRSNDVLIAISSSGNSDNIINAVEYAKSRFMTTLVLSGFAPGNPLRALGGVQYYVPSSNYGVVEIAHLAILHSIVNPGL